jgi:hypothetical protein
MPEKLLFEIALDRILLRLSQLKGERYTEAVMIFRKTDGFEFHDPSRHAASRRLAELLFPDLYEKIKSC